MILDIGMKLRRIFAALLACVATLALALLATQSPTSAAPQENFAMPLINIGSNKCFQPVEPSGHVEWAGVPVQQRSCFLSYALQNWTFESMGYVAYNDQPWWCWNCIPDGTEGFFIRNQQTGLCLDARDGATSDWSVVQQWTCRDVNARSMVWYVQPGDFPDSFKIRNFNSDLCLDVAWGSWDDFAQIQQFHCTSNNPAQNFYQALWPRGTLPECTDGQTRHRRCASGSIGSGYTDYCINGYWQTVSSDCEPICGPQAC